MSERSGAGFTERERRDDDFRHGTTGGAMRHSKRKEAPCDACREAKAAYDKRRLEATDLQKRNRLHAKAQGQAHRLLAKTHPDEYRTYYLICKENLLREVEEP